MVEFQKLNIEEAAEIATLLTVAYGSVTFYILEN